MKDWYREYRCLFLRTRFIGAVGSIVLVLMILGELTGLQYAISVYEAPKLPDAIWWNLFATVFLACGLMSTLLLRLIVLLRGTRDEWLFLTTWLVCAGLFVFYISFLLEPPSSQVCSPEGICRQIYHSQRTDRIALAAGVFLPASLFRFLITGALAFLNLKSKLK